MSLSPIALENHSRMLLFCLINFQLINFFEKLLRQKLPEVPNYYLVAQFLNNVGLP